MVENDVSSVNKMMNLFAKRFRPAFAGVLRAGRSKAPSAASLSHGRLVNFERTGFDFMDSPFSRYDLLGGGEILCDRLSQAADGILFRLNLDF